MKVEFGTGSLDTDKLGTFQEITDYLNNIDPQTEPLPIDCAKEDFTGLEKFDQLITKEIAVLNLLTTIHKLKAQLWEKTFPSKVGKAWATNVLLGTSDNFVLPPVSVEDFELINKLSAIYTVAYSWLDASVYARVGYNVLIRIARNADIYVQKDLRDLHKKYSLLG